MLMLFAGVCVCLRAPREQGASETTVGRIETGVDDVCVPSKDAPVVLVAQVGREGKGCLARRTEHAPRGM